MSPRRRAILAVAAAVVVIVPAVRDARASDTVDSLLADLPRLAAVQEGCKADAPWATEALCREAAQAIRRRFHGGGVTYTPRRIEPVPGPAAPSSKPAPQVRPSARAALLS